MEYITFTCHKFGKLVSTSYQILITCPNDSSQLNTTNYSRDYFTFIITVFGSPIPCKILTYKSSC